MTARGPRVLIAAAGLVAIAMAASAGLAQPPAGDAAAGEDLFQDRCAMCHSPDGAGQGPSLTGVYGRKAGSLDGFAYSAALKAYGAAWTGPTLDTFLADPGKAVPGTAMPVMVPDAKQRANLIAYFAAHP